MSELDNIGTELLTAALDHRALVRYLMGETDGTHYQRLNRQMIVNGTAMDGSYRRALREVLDTTKGMAK